MTFEVLIVLDTWCKFTSKATSFVGAIIIDMQKKQKGKMLKQ